MMRLSVIASLVIIVDRLAKYYSLHNLTIGETVKVIPNIFHLTLVLNTGSAFGLFRGWAPVFIVLSAVIIAFIAVYVWRYKVKDTYMITALGLILGGAFGNLIDRVSLGYVIDFLDFRIWPVFNIADSSITIGAMLIAWRILTEKKCCTI